MVLNKMKIIVIGITVSVISTFAVQLTEEPKTEAIYHNACGCNITFYTNGFDNSSEDDFYPAVRVTPGYGESQSCNELKGSDESVLIIDEHIADCFMSCRVSRLSGYYMADKGEIVEMYAKYKSHNTPQMVQLPSIQKTGVPNTWRKFEYFMDFTHFHPWNEAFIEDVEFWVKPPDNGKLSVKIDQIEICTFCDGSLIEFPQFENIIVENSDNTEIARLDPATYEHLVLVPRQFASVHFRLIIPAELADEVIVTAANKEVDFSGGITENISQDFVVPEYEPRTVPVMLKKGDVNSCKFNNYKITLQKDDHNEALLSNVRVKSKDSDEMGSIVGGFNTTYFGEYTAIVTPYTTVAELTPIPAGPGLAIEVNGVAITDQNPSVDVTLTNSSQNPATIVVSDPSDPALPPNTYTVLITDLFVSFYYDNEKSELESNGSPVNLKVVMSRDATSVVPVDYYLLELEPGPGIATKIDDFTLSTGPLQFPVGSVEENIQVTLTDDSDQEGPEIFTIKLDKNGTVPVADIPSETFTILDDEYFEVEFLHHPYTYVNEAGPTGDVPVIIDNLPELGTYEVMANYEVVSGGSAIQGEDFDLAPGTIDWKSSSTSRIQNIVMQITDNDLIQTNKTVRINLTENEGTQIGAKNPVDVVIVDNDRYIVNFTDGEDEGLEPVGSPVTVDIPLSISEQVQSGEGPVIVNCAVDYSTGATSATEGVGNDFTLDVSSVSWTAGEGVDKNIQLTIYPDTDNEFDETVTLKIVSVIGATLQVPTSFTYTIVGESRILSFSETQISSEEAEFRSYYVDVQQNRACDQQITVPLTITGDAVFGDDYVMLNPQMGDPGSGQIVFAPQQTLYTMMYEVPLDDIDEETELILFNLGTPAPSGVAIVDPEKDKYYHYIIEQERRIYFTKLQDSYIEGEESSYQVEVRIDPPLSEGQIVTLPFTVSGTAGEVDDFSIFNPKNKQLTFTDVSPVDYIGYFDVADNIREPDETIIFTLGTPSGGDVVVDPEWDEYTRTIVNDDKYRIYWEFTSSSSGEDDNEYSAIAWIEPTPVGGDVITVDYTVTGTATPGTNMDYQLNPESSPNPLVFDNMNYSHEILFTVNIDVVTPESNETIILTMQTPDQPAISELVENRKVFMHTIMDCPCRVVYFKAKLEEDVSEGVICELYVGINPPLTSGIVKVPYTVVDLETESADYNVLSTNPIEFIYDVEEIPIRIHINSDNINDANERFQVDLENPIGDAYLIEPYSVERTISDDKKIIYVKTDGDDMNNGLSWNSPKATIQAAIDDAESGTQIWVAMGTYYPTVGEAEEKTITLKSGVELYGGFEGLVTETSLEDRDWENDIAYLSGDLDKDGTIAGNAYHVVTASESNIILDGFFIKEGVSDNVGGGMVVSRAGNVLIKNNTFESNVAKGNGGGISCTGVDGIIENCRFYMNGSYTRGGGIYALSCELQIKNNCIFDLNYAQSGGAIHERDCDNQNSFIEGCNFNNNYVSKILPQIDEARGGGAISFYNSNTNVTSCTFFSNSYQIDYDEDQNNRGGGAVLNNYSSSTYFLNCKFKTNNSWGMGGAVANRNSSPHFVNCLFVNNSSNESGGAIVNYSTLMRDLEITNSTFYQNNANAGGAIYVLRDFSRGFSTKIRNSIFWANTAQPGQGNQFYNAAIGYPGDLDIAFCIVEGKDGDCCGGEPPAYGNGVLDLNPRFVSGPGPDGGFYLEHAGIGGGTTDSPCIDAGSDTAENLGLDDKTTCVNTEVVDKGQVDIGYHYEQQQ